MHIQNGNGKQGGEETEKVKKIPSLLTNKRILDKNNGVKNNICSVNLKFCPDFGCDRVNFLSIS